MLLSIQSLALFAVLLGGSSAARTHEENGRKVRVYVEPLPGTENDDLSNKKCVEYAKGGTADLTTACFDTVFNVNGIYVDCMMYYNDVPCTSCKACVSADDDRIPGFNLDCNNILPSKTVLSTCPPLNDRTIQEYLTNDGHFSNTLFMFDLGENEGEETMAPSKEGSSSSELRVAVATAVAALSFFLSL